MFFTMQQFQWQGTGWSISAQLPRGRKAECWFSPQILLAGQVGWTKLPLPQLQKSKVLFSYPGYFTLAMICAVHCIHSTAKIPFSQMELLIWKPSSLGWTLHIHTDRMIHCSSWQCLALDHSSLKQMLRNTIAFILVQKIVTFWRYSIAFSHPFHIFRPLVQSHCNSTQGYQATMQFLPEN